MKAKNKFLGIFVLLQSLFFGNNLFSQMNREVITKLDSYLSIQKEQIGFNGVVLVAETDHILCEKAFGQSSFELRVPVKIDTKFKIASITKSFTGLLLALAEQEGKLEPSNSLKTYFPDAGMNTRWPPITLKELVSHTSRIPHWKGCNDYWSIKSRIPMSKDKVLADIFTMELIDNPGPYANYSSPAYFLLATILEKVYKKSYDGLVQEKITDPFGMERSGTYDGIQIVPQMASGCHRLPNDRLIIAPYREMATMKGGATYTVM